MSRTKYLKSFIDYRYFDFPEKFIKSKITAIKFRYVNHRINLVNPYIFLCNKTTEFDRFLISTTLKGNFVFLKDSVIQKIYNGLLSEEETENLLKSFKVLKTFTIDGLNDHEIDFDLTKLNEIMSVKNVFSIVLFHTHPCGNVEPSLVDYETTQKICNICCMMGVYLSDHIILNEMSHFSFGRNNLLADMYERYHKLFPEQDLNFEVLNKLGIKLKD